MKPTSCEYRKPFPPGLEPGPGWTSETLEVWEPAVEQLEYRDFPNTSPFTLCTVDQRPRGATQICILAANEDHGLIQGTGNYVDLP